MSADDGVACLGRWPRADHRIADLATSIACLSESRLSDAKLRECPAGMAARLPR